MGRDLNPLTQPSVFHVLGYFSGLFPLPDASNYLVSHMESIRRGNSLLQALVCCCLEPSQTTSLTLRTKACSLLQRQAVTGQQQGRSPDFLLLSPAWRRALQHVPAGLQGEREDRPQHADENPNIRSYSRAEQLLQMDLSLPVLEFCWSSPSIALHPSVLWEPMH